MGSEAAGASASTAAMRAASSLKAATYSDRANSGGMTQAREQHRHEPRRSQRTALQPQGKNTNLGTARIQTFRERQVVAAIEFGQAREHHGDSRHEKARAEAAPDLRVQLAGRTVFEP